MLVGRPDGASVQQVACEPGDLPGEPGIGTLVGGLRACQLEDESECFLGKLGGPGQSPRTSLCYEVMRTADQALNVRPAESPARRAGVGPSV